jgi:hypothetical protein
MRSDFWRLFEGGFFFIFSRYKKWSFIWLTLVLMDCLDSSCPYVTLSEARWLPGWQDRKKDSMFLITSLNYGISELWNCFILQYSFYYVYIYIYIYMMKWSWSYFHKHAVTGKKQFFSELLPCNYFIIIIK